MSAEKIQQEVNVSDHAQVHGDITLIGKIVNVVKHPAQWQDVVFNFLSAHRYFLIIATILEIGLLALHLIFKELYRIPWWTWALAAGLLLLAGWCWYTFWRYARSPIRLALTVGGVVGLTGILGWQGWGILNPPAFDPADFGIAVAELDDGSPFSLTDRTALYSDQIYDHLCRSINQGFEGDSEGKACIGQTAGHDSQIMVRRIGKLTNAQTAQDYGERIGAEIIIWGQIVGGETEGATIRFEILETLDQAVNPNYPLVMPVTSSSTDIFSNVTERDLADDPVVIKALVSQQAIVISSFVLGLAAYLDQNYPQTIIQLKTTLATLNSNEGLEVTPKGKSLLYYYLGKTNHLLSRIDEGQDWLNQAQVENPEEPSIYMSLALGYGSLGRPLDREENLDIALRLLNDWLLVHPDDSSALYDRGLVHYMRDKNENAALDFEAALAKNPSFFIVHLLLGDTIYRLGRPDEAVEWLEKALSLAETSGANAAWAYLYLGAIYQQEGEVQLADQAYRQAISHEPEVEQMYFFYAHFLEKQQEVDAALIQYQKLTEVSFNKGWAFAELAQFYRRSGLLENAVTSFHQAVNADTENPLYHTYLAETFNELNRTEDSLAAFAEAAALNEDKGIPYVYSSYAGALYGQGELEQAVEMYQKSLALDPFDFPVLLNLGQCYELLGNLQAAAETYQRIIDLEDQFPDERIQIARERLDTLEQTLQ